MKRGNYIELIELEETIQNNDKTPFKIDHEPQPFSGTCLPIYELGSLVWAEIRSKYAFYKAHLSNNFSNQVILMEEIMPAWALLLSQYKAYGHYTFLCQYSDDVAVYFNLADIRPELKFIERKIKQLFESHGCRVINIKIRYLDQQERKEPYHQQYLHHPLDNQRYQLFLLGLENRVNWQIYCSSVEYWEIDHFIGRYLRTHLTMFLDQMGSMSFTLPQAEELEVWLYIFKPFFDLGILLPDTRNYYMMALDNVNTERIGLVELLLLQSYNVSSDDSDQNKTGFWQKTFCLV